MRQKLRSITIGWSENFSSTCYPGLEPFDCPRNRRADLPSRYRKTKIEVPVTELLRHASTSQASCRIPREVSGKKSSALHSSVMSNRQSDELAAECMRMAESCLYTSTSFFIWLRLLRIIKVTLVIISVILGSLASFQLIRRCGYATAAAVFAFLLD